jgi:hypothetical protein
MIFSPSSGDYRVTTSITQVCAERKGNLGESGLDVLFGLINECVDPGGSARCISKPNSYAFEHQSRSDRASATGEYRGSADGADGGCTIS